MGQRIEEEKMFFNSVFNFRRVTHLGLCLLETQVGGNNKLINKAYKKEGSQTINIEYHITGIAGLTFHTLQPL